MLEGIIDTSIAETGVGNHSLPSNMPTDFESVSHKPGYSGFTQGRSPGSRKAIVRSQKLLKFPVPMIQIRIPCSKSEISCLIR